MTTREAREAFSETLNRVVERKEHVVLHRRGKDLAALIPVEELRLLERLLEEIEDRADVAEVERRLADPREKPIPFEKVIKDLGLA